MKYFKYRHSLVLGVSTFTVLTGFLMASQVTRADTEGFGIGQVINSNDSTRPGQKQLETPKLNPIEPKAPFELPHLQPAPKANDSSTEGTIEIKKIDFTGNTVISNEELQKLIAPFLTRKLSVRDLEDIRSAVTAVYTDAGYINSGAVIPSQSTTGGLLKIKIIEGNLTEVHLEGMGRLRDFYVKDRFLIGAGSPLNVKKLQEKYQLLLRDPLIEQLNGKLVPGSHPGESILDVTVKRARPYQLYAGTDDYTTPLVGGYTGRLGGWVDNLTGFGERIDADFMATGGSLGVNTGVDIPISAYDTHAIFRYSDTQSSLIEVPQSNIKSHTIAYDGGLSQSFYRSLAINFTAGVNFAVKESTSSFLGTPFTFTEGLPFGYGTTQDSVIRMWQQYTQQGSNNAFVFRSTFNKGVNALGATIQNTNLPSGDFFDWVGQSQYLHKIMANGANIVLKGSVQIAQDPLLPMERFSVGGVNTVRGYRENYYVRDNGFATSLEFHYPIFGGDSNAKHSLFLVPFMDYGGAWNNATRDVTNPTTNYLHSAGLGFNWHYSHANTEIYYAHDLAGVKPPQGGTNIQDNGIHFKVNFLAF
jgi:hemolysin activation/secretion protein